MENIKCSYNYYNILLDNSKNPKLKEFLTNLFPRNNLFGDVEIEEVEPKNLRVKVYFIRYVMNMTHFEKIRFCVVNFDKPDEILLRFGEDYREQFQEFLQKIDRKGKIERLKDL